jgi:hypothetical protein
MAELRRADARITISARFKTLKLNSPCKATAFLSALGTNLALLKLAVTEQWEHRISWTTAFPYDVYSCAALPLVGSAGTTIACTTKADLDARIAAVRLFLRNL